MSRSKIKNNHNRLSFKTSLFYFFNFTAGISFLLNFPYLFGSSNNSSVQMGWYWFLFLTISWLLSWVIASAFSYLHKYHYRINGGSFIYARTTLGRFWGYFIGMSHYLIYPISITYLTISFLKNSLIGNSSGQLNTEVIWGINAGLYLDLIGIAIFIIVVGLIMISFQFFSKMVAGIQVFNWIGQVVLLGFIIALIINNHADGFNIINNHSYFNFNTLITGIIISMSCFIGFSAFNQIGQNVVNSRYNMPRLNNWIMILSMIYHVFFSVLMIGTAMPNTFFGQNPLLNVINANSTIAKSWKLVGTIFLLLTIAAPKLTRIILDSVYGGYGTLLPLIRENYLPTSLQKLNKNNVPYRVIICNIVIAVIWLLIFLIIPDIITITLNIMPDKSPFNITNILKIISIMVILIYIINVIIAIKIKIKHKKPISNFMFIAWWTACIITIAIVGAYFYALINNLQKALNQTGQKETINIVFNSVLLGYFLFILIAPVSWYYLYYKPRYYNRLKNNFELQKLWDVKFEILPYDNIFERMINIIDIPLKTPQRYLLALSRVIKYDLDINSYQEQESITTLYSKLIAIPNSNSYKKEIIKAQLLYRSLNNK